MEAEQREAATEALLVTARQLVERRAQHIHELDDAKRAWTRALEEAGGDEHAALSNTRDVALAITVRTEDLADELSMHIEAAVAHLPGGDFPTFYQEHASRLRAAVPTSNFEPFYAVEAALLTHAGVPWEEAAELSIDARRDLRAWVALPPHDGDREVLTAFEELQNPRPPGNRDDAIARLPNAIERAQHFFEPDVIALFAVGAAVTTNVVMTIRSTDTTALKEGGRLARAVGSLTDLAELSDVGHALRAATAASWVSSLLRQRLQRRPRRTEETAPQPNAAE